jgi:Sec-independent protein secretion pathway component TatC
MKIFHRTKKEFRPVLITSSFVLIVGSGLAYFVSLGIVLPIVPQYAKERLGGSSVEVGIAVGAPFLGRSFTTPLRWSTW